MKTAWYRYEIDLGRVVRLGTDESRTRRGFILRIEDDEGRVAAGEAAPIDGYGSDTEADVRSVLATAATSLSAGFHPEDAQDLAAWTRANARQWPASVRFAVESALMYLAAESARMSPGEWLGGVRRPLIRVCGLPGPGDVMASPSTASVFKLKVGTGDPVDEGGDVASRLRSAAAGRVRCDANRAWSIDEANRFVDAFIRGGGETDRFEFLEEPLRDPSQLTEFAVRSPVPVALDETVLQAGPDFDASAWQGIRYFVVKPSLVGGITESARLAKGIRSSGGAVVVSSAFESGLGLVTAAWFASTIDGPAAGFGSAPLVLNDELPVPEVLLESPIPVAGLPANPAHTIRFDALEEIDG